MITWTPAQRRARLVARHHLDGGAASLEDVVDGVVGLHATDPLSVFLQVRARRPAASIEEVTTALYDDRTLVRVLGMRRTMFVVPPRRVPVFRAGVTDKLADRELRRSAKMVVDGGLADDGRAWMRAAGAATLAALDEHGPMTAIELREHVPALTASVEVAPDKKWGGTVGMSTRVLFWLATRGVIIRGRPRGTIASSMYEWVRADNWLPDDPGGAVGRDLDEQAAAAELAAAYLQAFGPVTFEDLQWWTGWTKTLTRAALARVDPTEVDLGAHGTGLVLPGDDQPPGEVSGAGEPTVALLPALDATAMGFTQRGWYLGEHTAFPSELFDRNGNVGPTVWADGHVVGGWAQRDDGRVAWRLFEDVPVAVGADLQAAVARHADHVQQWLGDISVRPRFRTPWERELAGT